MMIVGAGGWSEWVVGNRVRARRAARRSRNRRKSIERSARRLARRGGLGELWARPDWSAASLYPVPRVQPVPRRGGGRRRRRRSAAAVSDDRSGVCSERTVTIAPASTRTTYAHAHQLSRAQKISVTSSTTTHTFATYDRRRARSHPPCRPWRYVTPSERSTTNSHHR